MMKYRANVAFSFAGKGDIFEPSDYTPCKHGRDDEGMCSKGITADKCKGSLRNLCIFALLRDGDIEEVHLCANGNKPCVDSRVVDDSNTPMIYCKSYNMPWCSQGSNYRKPDNLEKLYCANCNESFIVGKTLSARKKLHCPACLSPMVYHEAETTDEMLAKINLGEVGIYINKEDDSNGKV